MSQKSTTTSSMTILGLKMYYGAIGSILLTVILLLSSLAAFGAVAGTAVIVILLALAVCLWASESRWTRFVRVVAVLIGLAAAVGLALQMSKSARETARGMACEKNLRQIGTALRNYWDAFGSFPPACSYDKSGQPMHSWRLAILPFMDTAATYHSWNFSEPWDSPRNRKLSQDRKNVFKCPMDQTAYALDSTTTSYIAIVGNRAESRHVKLAPSNDASADQNRTNQTPDTFLVTELHDSGIQWTEPKDIKFDDVPALNCIVARSSHARNNGYFYHKTPAVNAVLVHGDMVFVFPWDSRSSVLSGLLPPQILSHPESPNTKSHRFSKDDYDEQLFQEELQVDWLHVVGLPVWIAAVALLVYRVR